MLKRLFELFFDHPQVPKPEGVPVTPRERAVLELDLDIRCARMRDETHFHRLLAEHFVELDECVRALDGARILQVELSIKESVALMGCLEELSDRIRALEAKLAKPGALDKENK